VTVYRYPPRSLIGDYLRAGGGLLVGIGVLAVSPSSVVVLIIFGGVVLLFGWFAARTFDRHMTQVMIGPEGIVSSGIRTRALAWDHMNRLKLRYFGTRRQQKGADGFMILTLKGQPSSLSFESDIEGFEEIARHAALAARRNGVSVDPASAGNLLAIGVDPDAEDPLGRAR
jgi:hypothetical protein